MEGLKAWVSTVQASLRCTMATSSRFHFSDFKSSFMLVLTSLTVVCLILLTVFSHKEIDLDFFNFSQELEYSNGFMTILVTGIVSVFPSILLNLLTLYWRIDIGVQVDTITPTFIILIPHIIFLCFHGVRLGKTVPVLISAQEIVSAFYFLNALKSNVSDKVASKFNPDYFFAILMSSYICNFYAMLWSDGYNGAAILSYIFFIIFFIWTSIFCCYYISIDLFESNKLTRNLSVGQFFCLCIFSLTLTQQSASFLVWVSFMNRPWLDKSTAEIIARLCVHIFVHALLTLVPICSVMISFHRLECTLSRSKMFVRQISHEIRNPLNVCFIGLEMMQDEFEEESANPSILNSIVEIRESCQLAIEILNEMLTYDKLSTGKLELELKSTHVPRLVKRSCKSFKLAAVKKGVSLLVLDNEMDLESLHGLRLNCDENKISQVIRNFLSNALKFTPRGGSIRVRAYAKDVSASAQLNLAAHQSGQPKISNTNTNASSTRVGSNLNTSGQGNSPLHPAPLRFIESMRNIVRDLRGFQKVANDQSESSAVVRIEVEDTGNGISLENQGKLFQEYYQIEPGKQQKGGGSGLGLSIAKSIIDMHSGCIGMASEGVGRGSTFFLELPTITVSRNNDSDDGLSSSYSDYSNSVRKQTDTPLSITQTPQLNSIMQNMELSTVREERESEVNSAHASINAHELSDSAQIAEPTFKNHQGMRTSDQASDTSMSLIPDSGLCKEIDDLEIGKIKSISRYSAFTEGVMTLNLPPYVLAGLPIHVLVVDDAVSNRKMLARMVTRDKHSYGEAEDGVEAVEIVAKSMSSSNSQVNSNLEFDAIYIDYTMPKMDGPEACYEIRKLGYTGMIYGVTGNVMPSDVQKFTSMGANKVLSKPLSIQIFRDSVKEIKEHVLSRFKIRAQAGGREDDSSSIDEKRRANKTFSDETQH